MPELEIEYIHVDMNKEQDLQYNYALDRVMSPVLVAKIKSGMPVNQKEAGFILGQIIQARQVSNSVSIFKDIPLDEAAEETPKIKKVMDDIEKHLKETSDGQAVAYTNFDHGGADVLYEGLKTRGLNPGIYTGAGTLNITKKMREKDVEDFNKGEKKVIIITPAGGEGLNLPNTTFFAELDRHYNPEKNQQAIARARRIGGLSHRPKEDRKIIVNRYFSDPYESSLKNWQWRRFGRKEVGIDEWVDNVAKEKDRLNEEMRSAIKGS